MVARAQRHIFTVGHADNSRERFLDLLLGHDITALADVRSTPYSRYHPQFNRESLRVALGAAGVRYVFMGDELGARRAEAECYVDGKARYELIARTPLFQAGLRRVMEGAERHRIALMCAEQDPITCHRGILVCRHLRPLSVPISHILKTGELETTGQMEQRLLEAAGIGVGGDLFASGEVAIERAYDIQGDRIAYTRSLAYAEERG